MSNGNTEKRIEAFEPKLRKDIERFALPGGDTGLYDGAGGYLRVSDELAPLLSSMDGRTTLRSLAIAGAASSRTVSITALLSLVAALAQSGFLENDAGQIALYDLPTGPRRGSLGMRFLAWFLDATVCDPRLGNTATRVLDAFRLLPLNTALLICLAPTLLVVTVSLLFAGKIVLPEDPLMLKGHYWAGLLAVYGGVSFTLAMRQFVRGWVLGADGLGVYAAGIESRLFVLAPHLDGRHVFRAGQQGQLRLALAGICGAMLAVATMVTLAAVAGNPAARHMMAIAAFGGCMALYGALTPFLRTDLGTIVDVSFPGGNGRGHALSYLKYRLLRRQGNKTLFAGELHHLLTAAATVLWVYVGFRASADVVAALVSPVALLPAAELPLYDTVVVAGVLLLAALALLFCILMFIGGLVRFVVGVLPKRAAAPRHLGLDEAGALATLSNSALFAHLPKEALEQIARATDLVEFKRGKDVVCQGEMGDVFYLVADGEAGVVVTADSGLETTVATLRPGDGFGEVALIEGAPRNATVRALTPRLSLYALERDQFLFALQKAEVAVEGVTALLRATRALRSSDVFKNLTPSALAKVVGMCARESHPQGDVVIREGDPGDRFYVIESGRVCVERQGEPQPIAELGPGDFFGEVALLSDAPRNASVRCTEPCVLLALDRNSFQQVMSYDFSAGMRLEHAATQRAVEGAQ